MIIQNNTTLQLSKEINVTKAYGGTVASESIQRTQNEALSSYRCWRPNFYPDDDVINPQDGGKRSEYVFEIVTAPFFN